VQRLKIDLSRHESADFSFRDGSMNILAHIRRTEFESWITEDLQAIEGCIESLLTSAGIAATKVDRVFLTGGTSFVPAVRRIFEERFGAERVRTGNEFTSVARGLALREQERRQTAGSLSL
jgi:hypothetical chaperone protein